MGGCWVGECFLCGEMMDEDDWDCAFDEEDFFIMAHRTCFDAIPERIGALEAEIERLKTAKSLLDAREANL